MSKPSSETMWTSTDDCFCQEQLRQRPSLNSAYAHRSRSSADIASKSTSGRGGAVAKAHLLQRVRAEAETQRLERDHLVGRDVAEMYARAELLDEPRLRGLRRRLEHEVVEIDAVDDLVDQAGSHLAASVEDPGGAALARFRDHLPRPRFQLLLDPLDPLVRRVHDFGVLRADLREDGEVAGELGDQVELPLPRDGDRAVGHLDVGEAELRQPALVVVDLPLHVDDLEEGSADDDAL